jgi:hypothetical protein
MDVDRNPTKPEVIQLGFRKEEWALLHGAALDKLVRAATGGARLTLDEARILGHIPARSLKVIPSDDKVLLDAGTQSTQILTEALRNNLNSRLTPDQQVVVGEMIAQLEFASELLVTTPLPDYPIFPS